MTVALSVSKKYKQGAEGTLKVPFAPRNLGTKLSESLVNNPPGVKRPFPLGPRKGGRRISSCRASDYSFLSRRTASSAPLQAHSLNPSAAPHNISMQNRLRVLDRCVAWRHPSRTIRRAVSAIGRRLACSPHGLTNGGAGIKTGLGRGRGEMACISSWQYG
jgi:hypothetical protein